MINKQKAILRKIIKRVNSARRNCQDWCDDKGDADDLIEGAKASLDDALGNLATVLKEPAPTQFRVQLPPIGEFGGTYDRSAQPVAINFKGSEIEIKLGEGERRAELTIERHRVKDKERWYLCIANPGEQDVAHLYIYPERIELGDSDGSIHATMQCRQAHCVEAAER